jgi:hypothetical protein
MRAVTFVALLVCASGAFADGPVLIVGIDTEFGTRPADSSHGSIDFWAGVIQRTILDHVTNGHTGILVIGGGKDDDDEVTDFWNQVGSRLGQPVFFANKWAVRFYPLHFFAMIAVANGTHGSGVLTKNENKWLNGRRDEIATFLCNGGGLFASSNNYDSAYGFLADVHPIQGQDADYEVVNGTPAGQAIGFPAAAEMGPWHTVFTSYPGYLDVLATSPNGRAAAIGTDDVGALVPVFTLAKENYCLGEPIIADTAGTLGEKDHFWSIQESDANWNRYGPELMRWMGTAATPVDLNALAQQEGLPLQCDRYYRVKLALTGWCAPWVETTQLIYVSCTKVDAGPDHCCDDYLVLGSAKGDRNTTWEWSPSEDIEEPAKRQTILRLKQSFFGVKSYTVTGTNKHGCRSSDTTDVYCGQPSVSTVLLTRNCCDATLSAASTPVSKLVWNDGSTSPMLSVTEAGTKRVDVSNACGKASASFTVPDNWFLRGPTPSLIAPAWFSPNGDGDRDVFTIYHLGIGAGQSPAYNANYYELWIRDRWFNEHLVSKSNTCGELWNGQIQWDGRLNGNVVQQDSYSWNLLLRNCDKRVVEHNVKKSRWVCQEERCFLWIFNCVCTKGYWEEYDDTREYHTVTVVK